MKMVKVITLEGTFELDDGTTTKFCINSQRQRVQWGNSNANLGLTVDVLDILTREMEILDGVCE